MALFNLSRRWPMLVGACVCSALLGILLSFFVERAAKADRALWGVELAGRSLTGLRARDIQRQVQGPERALSRSSVVLQLGTRSRSFHLAELGVSLDRPRTAQLALQAGRQHGITGELAVYFRALIAGSPLRFTPAVSVSQETLHQVLRAWTQSSLHRARAPSLVERATLEVDEGQVGQDLAYDPLTQALVAHALYVVGRGTEVQGQPPVLVLEVVDDAPLIARESIEQARQQITHLLSAPVALLGPTGQSRSLSPKELREMLDSHLDAQNRTFEVRLSVEKMRAKMRAFLAEVERPARDAGFELLRGQTPRILPSETGSALDEAEVVRRLWTATRTPQREVQVPLRVTEPKLSTAQAEGLHIKELVASFITRHACCQPRVDNIHTAAARLDNTVVAPGEKFSLNAILGPRSPSTGYKSAPTIVRGEMEDVYGGGISQLATTLFNAALRGGYKIVQRQPHSIYFTRYPEGHEATVSYPEPDLIFENDSAAGLLIKTEYTGAFIKVLIYGDTQGRVVSIGKSARYDIVQPQVEYETDGTLDPEKPKRARAGQMGWKVKVWRTVKFSDGHSTDERREVVYQPRAEIMRIHPCKLPPDHKDYSGERCPEPDEIKEVDREEELSDDVYYDTRQLEYDEEGG
jgi:vancomycin resistance protein YoaR